MNDYSEPDFANYPTAEPTEEEIAKVISHPALRHLNAKIANLESLLQAQKDTSARYADTYKRAELHLSDLLKELLDDEDISFENAERIADIFQHITLTKQITVELDITATVVVEVPYNADSDDVAGSIYVERIDFYSDHSNSDVLESDQDINDSRAIS